MCKYAILRARVQVCNTPEAEEPEKEQNVKILSCEMIQDAVVDDSAGTEY